MAKAAKGKQKTEKKGVRRDTLGYALRLFYHYLAGQRYLFVLALVMLVAEAAMAVFEAYPLAYLIDFLKGDRPDLLTFLGWSVTLGNPTNAMLITVALLTTAMIVMAAINSLGDSLAEIYLAKGGRMLGYNLRKAMYTHLQRLSLAYHDQRRTGDVLTRVTGDVGELEDFIIGSFSDIVGSILVLIGTLLFLVYQSWQVAIVAVVIVPVMALISNWFSQRIKSASKQQRAREGDLASVTQEMLTSIRVIQSFSSGDHQLQRFGAYNQKNVEAALVAAGLQARFSWVVKVMEAVAIAVVVWLGLWLLNSQTISVGMLLMFIILIQNMFKPTRKIIKEWNTFGKVFASIERIGELLDRKASVADAPNAVPAPAFRGQITFEGVSFAYQPDQSAADEGEEADEASREPGRQALHNVNFSVATGEVVALVGHTGAGKSTIVQLLPRLYDPTAGRILIDGQDLRAFTLDSLRAQMSMVLQETILFNGTVAENIAYGRASTSKPPTHDEIVNAATLANAHEFIEKLPDGYDTMLGERGANLSGGQRQRLAIARAFIRNAPILILDEPTTGLDTASAELVLLALRSLMKGKTTIIVSHDFKLVRQADQIVVIQEGRIAQKGSHRALVHAPGFYAESYIRQFGAVEADEESEEEGAAFDLLRSPLLQQRLPALTIAFDGSAMTQRLQSALFGAANPRYQIEECTPGKAAYLPNEGCTLRYEVLYKDTKQRQTQQTLVLARIFTTPDAAESYLATKLKPLVATVQGRDELAPFVQSAALLPDLNMVIHLFPVDGELPTLIAATDPVRLLVLLHTALPAVRDRQLRLADCHVELGHYGRQHRCVLRYLVDGHWVSNQQPYRQQIYGKVAADGRGELVDQALTLLRRRLREFSGGARFAIPNTLGYYPDLQLILLSAVPGTPRIAGLLKERWQGNNPNTSADLTVENAIATAAEVCAQLHLAEIQLGRLRTLQDEMNDLQEDCQVARQLTPALAVQLQEMINRLKPYLAQQPLPYCFSHGDFTHTQLIFDGVMAGLVDFDTVCQAEPALDIGQFQAYLRLVAAKAQRSAATPAGQSPSDDGATALCTHFLKTYTQAAGYAPLTATYLERRVAVYEVVSLLRIALHSWQKLKAVRLEQVLTILEERIACLPPLTQPQPVAPRKGLPWLTGAATRQRNG
jgi:ABC-type multidrug transport system fused ATPase/permease subunit